MTKEEFIFNLKRCGCLYYKDGKTYYEENELIECFEDVGAFKQADVLCEIWQEIEKLSPDYPYTDDLLDRYVLVKSVFEIIDNKMKELSE